VSADPLSLILVFLSVTGLVLALTSLSGPRAGRTRVRILRRAGDGPLAPIADAQGSPSPEPAPEPARDRNS
jgi:hypothetical protein